jgi:hypothetical protein
LQIAASGLNPGKTYTFALVDGSEQQDLVSFTAGIGGAAIAQTLGPLKRAVAGSTGQQPLKLEVRSNQDGRDELILHQTNATQDNEGASEPRLSGSR